MCMFVLCVLCVCVCVCVLFLLEPVRLAGSRLSADAGREKLLRLAALRRLDGRVASPVTRPALQAVTCRFFGTTLNLIHLVICLTHSSQRKQEAVSVQVAFQRRREATT